MVLNRLGEQDQLDWERASVDAMSVRVIQAGRRGSKLGSCSEVAAAAQRQRPAVGIDQGSVQRPGPPGRPGLHSARVVGGGAAGWAGPAPARLVPGVEGGGGLTPGLESLDRVDQVGVVALGAAEMLAP